MERIDIAGVLTGLQKESMACSKIRRFMTLSVWLMSGTLCMKDSIQKGHVLGKEGGSLEGR